MAFLECKKFVCGESCSADKTAQCSLGNFLVVGNRKGCDAAVLDEDDVAAPLAGHLPPVPLEELYDFTTADTGYRRH